MDRAGKKRDKSGIERDNVYQNDTHRGRGGRDSQ